MDDYLTDASEVMALAREMSNREEHPWSSEVRVLRVVVNCLIKHLESLQPQPETASGEQRATTAPSTTGERWAVEASTLHLSVESWRWGRVTTESLVEQLFMFLGQRGQLLADARILALAAQARKLTSPSPASSPSVATSDKDAATSPSGSSEFPSQCTARNINGKRCEWLQGHAGTHTAVVREEWVAFSSSPTGSDAGGSE